MTEGSTARELAALARIAGMSDPNQLRVQRENAKRVGSKMVEEAAFRRLVEILPNEQAGTVEYDFWRSIHTLEEVLTEERQKTTRLSRTRQKIGREGEVAVLAFLTLKPKPSDGFSMLAERDLLDLAAESVVLRHKDEFDEAVVAAARKRLKEYEIREQDARKEPHQWPTSATTS